ncbi:hypothetical protein D9758_014804 [Tetrapyrgos nigripes]|uniref:Mucoidy inhibitor A n=1 Tax=Tetrapyrgos nigripes TaxID=182062 RepID=A0A8H5C5R5_9AGAR|nr:hypothetical protein D9758_014804 [Tetrapyrgos nigripes]
MTIPACEEQNNVVDVISAKESKILNISLYSGRAEVIRLLKTTIKEGVNTVNVLGLPNVLEDDSLRVEGRGSAIIQDVTVSEISASPEPKSSPALEDLKSRKRLLKKALHRCSITSRTLTVFMENAASHPTDFTRLQDITQQFSDAGKKVDKEEMELETELKEVEAEIEKEKKKLSGAAFADIDPLLKKKVSIGLYAEKDTSVELVLTYGVIGATWDPLYDVRVNMQAQEKPITILYKAAITQTTGESWDNVSLTLETALPTYGIAVPKLDRWPLSVFRNRRIPPTVMAQSSPSYGQPFIPPAITSPTVVVMGHRDRSRSPRRRHVYATRRSRSRSRSPSPLSLACSYPSESSLSAAPVANQVLSVTSKGNVSATFRVPGVITVPSDGQAHNVTVAELTFDAALSWISVPKLDKRVHLHAKIKNDSEYTFIAGPANIYVDGTFIAKAKMPAVNPQESFDFSLGLDPSIRVTYHPISKKNSQSGIIPFTQKTTSIKYSQRITVLNTKTTPVDMLKIQDVIPTSDDEQITVKLLSPALRMPLPLPPPKSTSPDKHTKGISSSWRDKPDAPNSSRSSFNAPSFRSALSSATTKMGSIRAGSGTKEKCNHLREMEKLPGTVVVSKNILAQWAGVGEPDFDEAAMGKDGKINWICSLQPGETVTCTMEWEVSHPNNVEVVGLR